MNRFWMGMILAAGWLGPALAQSDAGGNAGPADPNSSVVTPGVAKPPPGAPKPPPKVKRQPNGSSAVWANQPTLPQIALHPQPTIGSPIPIAGPGGTTREVKGQ